MLPFLDFERIIDLYLRGIYSAGLYFETEANMCAWTSIFVRS